MSHGGRVVQLPVGRHDGEFSRRLARVGPSAIRYCLAVGKESQAKHPREGGRLRVTQGGMPLAAGGPEDAHDVFPAVCVGMATVVFGERDPVPGAGSCFGVVGERQFRFRLRRSLVGFVVREAGVDFFVRSGRVSEFENSGDGK